MQKARLDFTWLQHWVNFINRVISEGFPLCRERVYFIETVFKNSLQDKQEGMNDEHRYCDYVRMAWYDSMDMLWYV